MRVVEDMIMTNDDEGDDNDDDNDENKWGMNLGEACVKEGKRKVKAMGKRQC